MFRRRTPALGWLHALLLLCAIPSTSHANWASRGEPVADDNGFDSVVFDNLDHGHAVCSDGSGGLICGYVASSGEIRVNRLAGETGNKLWGDQGVEVNVGGNSAGPVHTVSDSAGGCWLVWRDTRASAPGLYMQRVDANGVPQLASGGVRLTAAAFSTGTNNLDIASTTSGCLLVGYWESDGLKVQRVLPNGTLNLGATGVRVTTDTPTHPIRIVPVGENAIVVWGSARASLPGNSGESRILANRVNASNTTPQWGSEGTVVIASAGVTATLADAATDGNSLFVAFLHNSAAGIVIRAQKFNLSGVVQWGTVVVMTKQDTPFDNGFTMKDIRAAEDGAGGLFVAWVDYRNFNQPGDDGFIHNTDLYAQRMNSTGAPQWTANGAPADTGLGTQEDLRICADGAGGIFLAYTDLETSFDANGDDASAARMSPAGTRTWKEWITSDFPNDTEQYEPMLARDGAGGVLVAWTDERWEFNSPDVYGIRLNSSGNPFNPTITVTAPNGGESFIIPDSVRVTWTSNVAGNVKIEYARTGQPRVTIVASTPNDGAFDWFASDLIDGPAKIFISDAADGSPIDSSNTAFTFCPLFETTITSTLSASAGWGIAAGDFNEDGIQDIAIGGSTGVRISLGLGAGGVGNGQFGSPTTIALGAAARGIAAGDLNEDGRLDLVATTSAGLARMLGNGVGAVGNGTFGTPTIFATGLSPTDVELADFNEDGILDAIVCNDSSATVSRFIGQGSNGVGNGNFATKFDYAVQNGPWDVTVQDLDGDGVLDLAVVNAFSNSLSILMGTGLQGNGGGGFAPAVHFPIGLRPTVVAPADINHDSVPELLVGTAGPKVTTYFLTFPGGQPAVTPGETAVLSPEGFYTYGIIARDFNGDGRLDIAVSDFDFPTFRMAYGEGPPGVGDGSFRLGGTLGTAAGQPILRTVLCVDALEDGVPDLMVGTQTGEVRMIAMQWCGTAPPTALSWGSPAPQCHLPGTMPTLAWSRSDGVAAVHLEASRDDGVNWERLRSDVVTRDALEWRVALPTTSTLRFRVVDAHSHNNVAVTTSGYAIRTGLGSATTYTMPDTGRDAAIADFNSDGIADLAVAHRSGVRVHRGLGSAGVGDGSFTTMVDLSTSAPATQVETTDLDDDGILDLVIGTDIGYEVRRGDGSAGSGNGQFLAAVALDLGNVTRDLALGDFDENGVQDLVLAPRDSAFVFLALGQGSSGIGTGSFAAPARYPLPHPGRAIEVVDVNEDNVPDVLAVSGTAAAGQLSWLRGVSVGGIGTGALHIAVSSATGPDPRSLAVLDLNHDRMLDVIAGGGNAGIFIHLGQGASGVGNGSFTLAGDYKAYEANEAVSAIAVAPLDGKLYGTGSPSRDLAIVSENDDSGEHWWLVVRDSTAPDNEAYAHATGFAFGKSEGLVLGDFNEDGYEDVALWGSTGPQLRVALGNCSDPKDTFSSTTFINAPNGGGVFTAGNNHSMSWDTQEHLWDVDVSRDNGHHWETVARYTARTAMNWTVTGPNTAQARVRLRRSLAPGALVVDVSDAVFTISGASVDVTDTTPPAAITFSPAWPNPSRGPVRFELALPQAAPVMLEVHDVQGRRVASIARAEFPAGRHTITWEGRSHGGDIVPAGLYFVRLRAGAFDATRQVVRIH